MATIKFIKARQIFDSRGNPTVEVDVGVEVPEHKGSPILARAAVPSGASTGIYEALELRDGGKDYLGKGVSKAVENVNKIIGPALLGKDPTEQTKIDNYMVQELDGTVNEWGWCKQKLGANAILAVSLAVCKAGAMVKKIPLYQHIANLAGNKTLVLPVPAFNVINGGSHAGNKLAMQEFMILPVGASSFTEAMKMGVEVYHHLKAVSKKKYGQDATNVGDEGGFTPNIQENKEGLELLKTAIAKVGYTGKVVSGIAVAALEFYDSKDKTYDLNFKENNDGSQKISVDSLKNVYKSFVSDYTIVSIEDPFDQDDWEHYAKMMAEIGQHVQIFCDDLLQRVEKAIWEKACNAPLLKVNQIVSVTESIEEERVAICVISLYAFTGISSPQTMRVVGNVLGQRLHVLIDSGSTHNFVSVEFAKKIGCDKVAAPAFEVMVANGALLQCDEIYKSVPMEIQGYEFQTSLYPLKLQGFDVVLGVEWLQSLGKVIHDWKNLTMEFTMDGREHVIRGNPILHGAVHSLQKLMACGLTSL